MLRMFLQVKEGRHYLDPLIVSKQVKKMVLKTKKPGVVNIDGELYKHDGQVDIQCLPSSFKLFASVPEENAKPEDKQKEPQQDKLKEQEDSSESEERKKEDSEDST